MSQKVELLLSEEEGTIEDESILNLNINPSEDEIDNFPSSLLNYFAFNSVYITLKDDTTLFINGTISNYCCNFINRGKPLMIKPDGSFESYSFKNCNDLLPGWAGLVNDDFLIYNMNDIPFDYMRYNLVGEIVRSRRMLEFNDFNVNGETLVNFAQYVSNTTQDVVFVMWNGVNNLKMLNIVTNKPIVFNMIGMIKSFKEISICLFLCKHGVQKPLYTTSIDAPVDHYYSSLDQELALFDVHRFLCRRKHAHINDPDSDTKMIFCIFTKLFMKKFVKQ
jgi:hypothetical protein